MVAVDGTGRSRPLESAQVRGTALERDELSDGRVAGPALEADDEPDLERLREPLKCCDARAVLTRLDARDGGVARAHSLGELLLREAELRAARDHESSDPLIRCQAPLRGAVLDTTAPPPPRIGC